MTKNKKLPYGILIVTLLVVGTSLFVYSSKPTPPLLPGGKIKEYYGSSTYGQCQRDNDCFVSGCNSEICQSKNEEPLVSICILPDKPTPEQLDYKCRCVNRRCQWSKPETYPKDFWYEIKGCKSAEGFKNNSISLKVLGNSIEFTQILNTYCNADKDNLKLRYNRRGNILEINEIFKSTVVAKCICPVEIRGTISNLKKGVYKIKFIFHNQVINQKEVIDVLKFEIK